jgi:hypothetical protein
MKTVLPLCALGVGFVLVVPSYAWAYIDPGTGSYVFQLAIAGFLAGVYTLRAHLVALKDFVRGKRAGRGSDVRDGR